MFNVSIYVSRVLTLMSSLGFSALSNWRFFIFSSSYNSF